MTNSEMLKWAKELEGRLKALAFPEPQGFAKTFPIYFTEKAGS